jgi:phosphatidylinositol alpha-1,6-mannosyltransferase
MTARVLAERATIGRGIEADLLVVSDSELPVDLSLPAWTARGSRLEFAIRAHSAALRSSHFIYDFLGTSRAHCRLPPVRRPFLVWIHGVEVWEKARSYYIQAADRADMVVANSEHTRARAQECHGRFRRARVCWLATESDHLPPWSGAHGNGPPTVLIVARIDADGGYKGHRELISAWPTVTDAVQGARLRIVGGGPGLELLKRDAARSSAAASIEVCGFVPEQAMVDVWKTATVLAMPSRGEGFGLTYIEAMRHGIPVVASVHDAGREVSVDGATGFNVNLDRPGQLEECLIELLRDRDLASRLGKHGQSRWSQHFRYSCFRDRFSELLDEFLH